MEGNARSSSRALWRARSPSSLGAGPTLKACARLLGRPRFRPPRALPPPRPATNADINADTSSALRCASTSAPLPPGCSSMATAAGRPTSGAKGSSLGTSESESRMPGGPGTRPDATCGASTPVVAHSSSELKGSSSGNSSKDIWTAARNVSVGIPRTFEIGKAVDTHMVLNRNLAQVLRNRASARQCPQTGHRPRVLLWIWLRPRSQTTQRTLTMRSAYSCCEMQLRKYTCPQRQPNIGPRSRPHTLQDKTHACLFDVIDSNLSPSLLTRT